MEANSNTFILDIAEMERKKYIHEWIPVSSDSLLTYYLSFLHNVSNIL